MSVTLDTIVNLSKRRGFVFPSSEIYGGLRSAYDYGPLGVELLRNVASTSSKTPTCVPIAVREVSSPNHVTST